MKQIAFLAEDRINILSETDGKFVAQPLNCTIAEKYREREREIRLKNEWKQSGRGAMFTGAYLDSEHAIDIRLPIVGLSQGVDERFVYSINFEKGGGIYFKHPNPEELETPILVHISTNFFELDVNSSSKLAVSCAENYLERHIALLRTDSTHLQYITEGDCCDCNPKWSLKGENVLYYDSAGIGYNNAGHFAGFGPRSIYRLNTETGELDEVLEHPEFDYCYPFEDKDGSLYFIRRPHKQPRSTMTVIDILTAPFKILRALGGMLDLFTRRHTGESLKSSGANPAKLNQKSQEQIYIDGNLLEAEKTLKKNAAAGDKNPGYAPQSWELVVRTPNGEEKVLHKSVMSYCLTPNGIVYSNGKYIVVKDNAVKMHLATKLISL